MSNGQVQPKPQAGFDEAAFLAACNQRTQLFADNRGKFQRWEPPDTARGADYLCELMSVSRGLSKDKTTDAPVPWARLTFRIADDEHSGPTGDSLKDKRFSDFVRVSSNADAAGMSADKIAALYGEVAPMPEQVGDQLFGLDQLVGCYYSIAVQTRNVQFGPNKYINACHGRGQQVTEPPEEAPPEQA